MVVFIWVLPLWVAILILIYQRASFSVVTIGVSVLLFILSVLVYPGTVAVVAIWLLWGLCAIFFNVHPLRQQWMTKKMMAVLKRSIPEFSPTEQAVLTAGNVGWEAELFRGMPDLKKLSDLPWVQLSESEQAFLAGPVEELCAAIDPWWINQHQQIPGHLWRQLKEQGFFGLVIPIQYGGKGFSAFAQAQIIMKLACASTAVATVAAVPNSLGPAELLLHYGTQQQKNHYLPRLARGEEVPCFALTSPVAGSDASAMTDSGIVCRYQKNGQDVLGIRLNWNKRYITLAPVATLLGLAFQLYDPDHLLGEREELGITCALVPVQTPGVHIGRHHDPLHCAFPNGPTQGVDVLVELDAIIGGVEQAGKGWQMLMERLAAGRSVSIPSIVMGSIKIAAASSGAYARIRRQFHTYIGDFGGVQAALAQVAGNAFIAESLRLFSVAQVDQGIRSATAAAISKYHATELGRKVIHEAMNIHGGKGICLGAHNYLGQLHIEAPIAMTVEGANILTRSLIIFGQGALRCHPYLLSEIDAIQQGDLKSFDRNFFAHLGYFLSHPLRAFILKLTHACFVAAPAGNNRCYYRQLVWFSAVFAAVADILLVSTGRALKRQELLSARLGDLLSDLYMVSAILKHSQVYDQNSEISVLVQWGCQTLFADFQRQLTELLLNLPNRMTAWWLRRMVLPSAKYCRWPDDRLTAQLAKSVIEPGSVRENLMANGYFGGALADLENTLQQIITIEPLLKKIYRAQREGMIRGYHLADLIIDAQRQQIISFADAAQVQAAEALRMAIINVDDFSATENVHG